MYIQVQKNYVTKTFVSFNFVKHRPIRNLFNDKIFPIQASYLIDIMIVIIN